MPVPIDSEGGSFHLTISNFLGDDAFAGWQLLTHLVFGWPAYLLFGTSGSPKRGTSNHFVPNNDLLFPDAWKNKVFISTLGVAGMVAVLWKAGQSFGFGTVVAVYVGPYLVVNSWLVLYTWLQHTDGIGESRHLQTQPVII